MSGTLTRWRGCCCVRIWRECLWSLEYRSPLHPFLISFPGSLSAELAGSCQHGSRLAARCAESAVWVVMVLSTVRNVYRRRAARVGSPQHAHTVPPFTLNDAHQQHLSMHCATRSLLPDPETMTPCSPRLKSHFVRPELLDCLLSKLISTFLGGPSASSGQPCRTNLKCD